MRVIAHYSAHVAAKVEMSLEIADGGNCSGWAQVQSALAQLVEQFKTCLKGP